MFSDAPPLVGIRLPCGGSADLILDKTLRYFLIEFLNTCLGNPGDTEKEFREFGEAAEVLQTGIRDSRLIQPQRCKFR